MISLGLLKTTHLLCCAANRSAQRISIYASQFGFLRALHLNIFEQPHHPLNVLSSADITCQRRRVFL
jgi:hypothetical protein